MDYNHAELSDLASKFQDDCLNREELARLNALLQKEDARRDFVDLAQVHYCLKVSELSPDCERLAISIDAVHRSIIPGEALMPVQPSLSPFGLSLDLLRRGVAKLNSRHSRRMIFGRLAVSVVLLLTLLAIMRPSSDNPAVQPVATVPDRLRPDHGRIATTSPNPANAERSEGSSEDFVARIVAATNGVSWAPAGAPRDFLMRLSPGEQIKVAQGLLKVEFGGGAIIILSGPADLQVLSSRSARLFAGSLTGRCDAGQFVLQTPNAEVMDIGTEFGVSVDTLSDTKVAVFEGEVHVKSSSGEPAQTSLYRLKTGMSVTIDKKGVMESGPVVEDLDFQRELPSQIPTNLGVGEVSLVDVICGSGPAEFRIAGAIDPLTGEWGKRPWTQPKGVELRAGEGQFVRVEWNSMVDGIFVPPMSRGECPTDSHGKAILLPGCSGTTWGPVWARRRINVDLDPFAQRLDQDDEGFWGAGTITAMLDRLRWARDGLVGLHANIGITIDLDAVRRERHGVISRLRGIVTLLERSHVSQPFQPKSLADFRVYVQGQERYQRLAFSREDGDAQFGATIEDSDRYLTLVVTDGGDGNLFDRVILIDPVLELSPK